MGQIFVGFSTRTMFKIYVKQNTENGEESPRLLNSHRCLALKIYINHQVLIVEVSRISRLYTNQRMRD